MSAIANLDELCPFDQRPIGDHTMREWSEHAGRTHTDLPYEEVPGVLNMTLEGQELVAADSLTARAAVWKGQSVFAEVLTPLLILEFGLGQPGAAPLKVVTVGFMASDPAMMRKVGKLVRDSANGAANAAEPRS